MAYFLADMTVEDVIHVLEKTKTVIVPVGVVEQHGYHLPLSTDIYNATFPLEYAGDKLNAVVAPPINYCFSGGELPGTINVSPNVFGLYLTEICSELARIGFKNIIAYLGHGGTENRQAMEASLQMVLRTNPIMKDVTISLISGGYFSETNQEIQTKYAPQMDFHAGVSETSRMLFCKPELVKMDRIVMDDEETSKNLRSDQDWYAITTKKVDHEYVLPTVHQRDEVKIGVMGFPHEATAELGKKIYDEIVKGFCEYVDYLNKENS